MLEVSPSKILNIGYGLNFETTLDISKTVDEKTISAVIMTIADEDGADVTDNFSLGSTEAGEIITFGITGYATGVYLIKFHVDYTDTAPDGSTTLDDDFYVQFTVESTFSLATTPYSKTLFHNLYINALKKVGLSTSEGEDLDLAKIIINEEYQRITTRKDWQWLYSFDYPLTATAKYETGTAAVINDSSTVTIASGAITSSMVGSLFKVSGFDEIYPIASVNESAQTMVLGKGSVTCVYNGTTDTAASYSIYKEDVSLPSDFLHEISIRQFRSPKNLDKVGIRKLRTWAPAPFSQTNTQLYGDPKFYADGPLDSSGNKTFILYPPPYRQIILLLAYKRRVNNLINDNDEPLIPQEKRYILAKLAAGNLHLHARSGNTKKAKELIGDAEKELTIWINEANVSDDDIKLVPPDCKKRSISIHGLTQRYFVGDDLKKL